MLHGAIIPLVQDRLIHVSDAPRIVAILPDFKFSFVLESKQVGRIELLSKPLELKVKAPISDIYNNIRTRWKFGGQEEHVNGEILYIVGIGHQLTVIRRTYQI